MRRLLQVTAYAADTVDRSIFLQCLFQILDQLLQPRLLVRRQLAAAFFKLPLHLVNQAVGFIALFYFTAPLLVLLLLGRGFFNHTLDFRLVQVAGATDRNLLLFTRGFIPGADLEDTVGIDII